LCSYYVVEFKPITKVRLEVNLAKKGKKRKLREWEVNEIFEDN
jgi:hypothetical protein